jgi:tRNA threonylcarbamoyladenosine biosynthesis protein TsaE
VGGMSHPLTLATTDAAGTQAVAGAIARRCMPGDILLLAGDLGAGKTTFAQGFGRALGIEESITSPTFTLVRQYPVGEGGDGSVALLIHADVYRLDHLQEITDLGIGELVEDGGVALVEWGDAAAPVLGEGALTVRLEAGPLDPRDPEPGATETLDEARTLTLEADAATGRWDDRWDELSAALVPWGVR